MITSVQELMELTGSDRITCQWVLSYYEEVYIEDDTVFVDEKYQIGEGEYRIRPMSFLTAVKEMPRIRIENPPEKGGFAHVSIVSTRYTERYSYDLAYFFHGLGDLVWDEQNRQMGTRLWEAVNEAWGDRIAEVNFLIDARIPKNLHWYDFEPTINLRDIWVLDKYGSIIAVGFWEIFEVLRERGLKFIVPAQKRYINLLRSWLARYEKTQMNLKSVLVVMPEAPFDAFAPETSFNVEYLR